MALVDFTPERLKRLATQGVVLSKIHGPVVIDAAVAFEPPVFLSAETPFRLPFRVGAFSHLNGGFIQNVSIGRYCSLARDVQIGHGTHPTDWMSVSSLQYVDNYRGWSEYAARHGLPRDNNALPFSYAAQTRIGNDVWIGNGVFIKDGLCIGDGAIVGAGSVVTRDVPPYMIVAGNPAKILKPRFPEKLIAAFLDLRWWRFALPHMRDIPFNEPALALEKLTAQIDADALQEFQPEIIELPAFFAHRGPA